MQNVTYTPETEQQTLAQLRTILTRSTVDADFRHRLLTQPNQTYAAATGNVVPDDVNFKFVESRGGLTLVPPPFKDDQLSDKDLETVSGGSEPVTIGIGAYCLGALAVTAGIAVGMWIVKEVVT